MLQNLPCQKILDVLSASISGSTDHSLPCLSGWYHQRKLEKDRKRGNCSNWWNRPYYQAVLPDARACLKNHSCNLHAPFCGTFFPNVGFRYAEITISWGKNIHHVSDSKGCFCFPADFNISFFIPEGDFVTHIGLPRMSSHCYKNMRLFYHENGLKPHISV